MRKALFLFLSVFIITVAYSQNTWKTYRHTLSFNFGLSTPLNDFGSTNANNPASGYALQGYVGDISFTTLIGRHIGFAGQLRGLTNHYDGETYDEQITAANADRGISWTMQTYRYGMASFTGGAYGMVYLTRDKKLMLDAKLLGGYFIIMHPDVDARGTDGTNSYFIGKLKKEASSLTWLAGLGLKWVVVPNMVLLANLDYQAARPHYTDFETRTGNTITTTSFTQKWAALNYTIGVGVTF